DHVLPQTLAARDDDLRVARAALIGRAHQLVIGADTRLGFRLARPRAGCDPLALARQRLLAGGLLAALLRDALGLGFQIGRIIAFVGDAPAAVELEYPARDIVEKISVMGDDQHRARIVAQMLFEPGR